MGDSGTARVPALECQQERGGLPGVRTAGLLLLSVPLQAQLVIWQGERVAQQAWPSSGSPARSPAPKSPPQGAGGPSRPWLSLGVGKSSQASVSSLAL